MEDEELPVRQKKTLKNLEPMSVEALTDYIDELQAEMERVRAQIVLKKRAQQAADQVFR